MAAGADTHHGAFGSDSFGRFAERVARFFGTPQYIVGQTIVVICWIAFNTAALGGLFRFDPEGRLRRAADPARPDAAGRPRQDRRGQVRPAT